MKIYKFVNSNNEEVLVEYSAKIKSLRTMGGEPIMRLLELMISATDYDLEKSSWQMKDIGFRFGAGYPHTALILDTALDIAEDKVRMKEWFTVEELRRTIITIARSIEMAFQSNGLTEQKKKNQELEKKVANAAKDAKVQAMREQQLRQELKSLREKYDDLNALPKETEFLERFLSGVMDEYKRKRTEADTIRKIMKHIGYDNIAAVLDAWIDEKEKELVEAMKKLEISRSITINGNNATYNENNIPWEGK